MDSDSHLLSTKEIIFSTFYVKHSLKQFFVCLSSKWEWIYVILIKTRISGSLSVLYPYIHSCQSYKDKQF